jgi:hypothetical protein
VGHARRGPVAMAHMGRGRCRACVLTQLALRSGLVHVERSPVLRACLAYA